MKILYLLDDFPPITYTGASVVTYGLAQGLLKKGHEIFIITSVQDKSKEGREEYNGLKIFRIYSNYHKRWQAYVSLYNPQVVSSVRKIIKEIKPDICHIQHIHRYLSYYCFKIAKKYCPAVFLTAHDTMLFHYAKLVEFVDQNDLSVLKKFNYKITPWQQIKRFKKRYNPFRNIIIKYYLGYVDKIFAVSSALKDALNQNGIGNVEVINNGTDIENWKIEKSKITDFKNKYNLIGKKIIFFGGRLSYFKGSNHILEAIRSIKENLNIVLLIVGRKDDYIKSLLNEFNDVDMVLTGWITGEELKMAYWSSDIIVTPSIYIDPFPTVNLEAMACKKPVVGTCFGGTPEIIVNNKTGYIVNPLDTQTMAKKIIDLLKNPQKAKQFGEAGYQRIKNNFSIKQRVEQTLNWYGKFF